MLNIPPEITITSFSIIGVLTGYIWNDQAKKIAEIKKKQNERPCEIVCGKIDVIQTDIRWIREILREKKK